MFDLYNIYIYNKEAAWPRGQHVGLDRNLAVDPGSSPALATCLTLAYQYLSSKYMYLSTL